MGRWELGDKGGEDRGRTEISDGPDLDDGEYDIYLAGKKISNEVWHHLREITEEPAYRESTRDDARLRHSPTLDQVREDRPARGPDPAALRAARDTPFTGDDPTEIGPGTREWRELARTLAAALRTTSNMAFRPDEVAEVRLELLLMKEEIARLRELTATQASMIEGLYEQLSKSSERIGRKDWLIMSIGAGTALVIAGLVPSAALLPAAAKAFHTLAHLFEAHP